MACLPPRQLPARPQRAARPAGFSSIPRLLALSIQPQQQGPDPCQGCFVPQGVFGGAEVPGQGWDSAESWEVPQRSCIGLASVLALAKGPGGARCWGAERAGREVSVRGFEVFTFFGLITSQMLVARAGIVLLSTSGCFFGRSFLP